jgi:hypothetical protein
MAAARKRSAGLVGGLLTWLAGATAALACPVCLGTADGPRLTLVQRLVETDLAVLATRGSSPATFRAVALIKGKAMPQREIVPEDFGALEGGKTDTVVLLRRAWPPGWSLAGPLPAERLDWARTVARFKRSSEMSVADWQTRVRFFAADLDAATPMVATAALDEITRAPYRAIRSLKGAIPAPTLARWIDAAGPPQRRKLAILLAGLDHQDGLVTAGLRQLSTAQDDGAAAALLTARLEIDGPAGIARVEADWAMAPGLSRTVSGSALLALRVHAEAEPELWRAPVGTAYRRIVTLNPSLAGMAASHLEALAMWDAAPALGQALADGILPDDAELPVLGFLRAGPTAAAAEAEAAIMARQQLSAGRRSSGSPESPPPVRQDK